MWRLLFALFQSRIHPVSDFHGAESGASHAEASTRLFQSRIHPVSDFHWRAKKGCVWIRLWEDLFQSRIHPVSDFQLTVAAPKAWEKQSCFNPVFIRSLIFTGHALAPTIRNRTCFNPVFIRSLIFTEIRDGICEANGDLVSIPYSSGL